MTVPSFLSALRIVLAFVAMVFLLLPGLAPKAWATAAFALASFTDWLDGYLARRLRQASAFGALLDPIADKVLTLGIFSVCAYQGLMPGWMLAVIAAREALITGVRLAAAKRRVVLEAAQEGKQKMVSQVVAILSLLLVSLLRANDAAGKHPNPQLLQGASLFASVALWAAVLFTLISGSLFFWRHRHALARLSAS